MELYTKQKDTVTGEETYVEVPESTPPTISDTINTATSWIKDRAVETSTQAGSALLVAGAPTIIENATKAITYGLTGNYVEAAQYGIPAIAGIFGSLYAIIKPDKKV